MTTAALTSSIIIPGAEELAAATPFSPGEVKVYPLAKRPGIKIMLITFDTGAVLAKHIAKGPITIQTLSGEVKVAVDGAQHDLHTGGLMHIDARIEHELVAPVRSRVLLTLFEEGGAGEPHVPGIIKKAQAEPVAGAEADAAATSANAPESLIPVTDVSAAGGHGGCDCGEEDERLPELDVRAIPHAIRHATVFGALQGLRPGNAMVPIAHHNPLPLLAQIEQMFAGAIQATFLQEGPEEWKLRMLRNA